MKKYIALLIFLFTIVIIICAFVNSIDESYSELIANDLAIDQLNGGDAAYITMQAWQDYRNALYYLGYAVTAIAIALIIFIIYKVSKERNK